MLFPSPEGGCLVLTEMEFSFSLELLHVPDCFLFNLLAWSYVQQFGLGMGVMNADGRRGVWI